MQLSIMMSNGPHFIHIIMSTITNIHKIAQCRWKNKINKNILDFIFMFFMSKIIYSFLKHLIDFLFYNHLPNLKISAWFFYFLYHFAPLQFVSSAWMIITSHIQWFGTWGRKLSINHQISPSLHWVFVPYFFSHIT